MMAASHWRWKQCDEIPSSTADFLAAARRDCQYAGFLVTFHAMLDDKDLALQWLEIAVNRGLINYPFLHDYDPFLAKFRGQPRFEHQPVLSKPGTFNCSPLRSEDWCATMPGTVMASASYTSTAG